MLKTFILFISICAFLATLPGHCAVNDEIMWKSAYYGDFSMTHKLMLTRSKDSLSDALLGSFVMEYLNYRCGKTKEAIEIYKGVDCYLEYCLGVDKRQIEYHD